jgi:hypothetical protein
LNLEALEKQLPFFQARNYGFPPVNQHSHGNVVNVDHMIISERENHGFPQLLHDFSMVYQRVYGVCSQVEGIFGMASFAKGTLTKQMTGPPGSTPNSSMDTAILEFQPHPFEFLLGVK